MKKNKGLYIYTLRKNKGLFVKSHKNARTGEMFCPGVWKRRTFLLIEAVVLIACILAAAYIVVDAVRAADRVASELSESRKRAVEKEITRSENEAMIAPKQSVVFVRHEEKAETEEKTDDASVSAQNRAEQVEMLAKVIYQEAGGNAVCDDCRRRVGDVVLNRVEDERFPDTMEEVLTARKQYGRFYWTGVVWADRAGQPGEKDAVERAMRVASEILDGQHSDLYGNGYVWQAEFEQGIDGFWCCGTYFGR